jgi:hypothetical protein
MVGRGARLVTFVALLALGWGPGAPLAADAQGTNPPSEASCNSFSQTLLAQAYGNTPWQIDPFEQKASPAFLQATQRPALEAMLAPYSNELGSLVGQQAQTATITPPSASDNNTTVCVYQANGVFQRGTATVGLVLVLSGDDWQVLRIRLHDVEHPASS